MIGCHIITKLQSVGLIKNLNVFIYKWQEHSLKKVQFALLIEYFIISIRELLDVETNTSNEKFVNTPVTISKNRLVCKALMSLFTLFLGVFNTTKMIKHFICRLKARSTTGSNYKYILILLGAYRWHYVLVLILLLIFDSTENFIIY